VDFSSSATDYHRHRRGFPPSFFARVPLRGDILDLGSGTGTIARGYAERGARVVALDVSAAMLEQAEGDFVRVVAQAEDLPFRDGSFDATVAGQCWHWFDGPRVARECMRVLRPRGSITIAHFDYLAREGNVAEMTERLILAANPHWTMAGGDGRYPQWRAHLEGGGFSEIDSFEYDEPAVYSHEAWRGRIRACNGVIAIPDSARREALDRELTRMLVAHPEPLIVPHRIFVIRARVPVTSAMFG
jgi:SAM-dependent methyltransferase